MRIALTNANRTRLSLLAVAAVLAVGGIISSQTFAAKPKTGLPPQGLFEACSVSRVFAECEARVRQMGKVGFKLVANVWATGERMGDIKRYAAVSQSAGVKNIWSLQHPIWWQNYDPNGDNVVKYFAGMAYDCPSCKTNDQLLAWFVNSVKGPNTYGYYIADDSSLPPADVPKHLPGLRALHHRIKQLDPNGKTIVSNITLNRKTGQELSQFDGAADIVLQENYPIRKQKDLRSVENYTRSTSRAMAKAKRPNLAVGSILQAWSWSDIAHDTSQYDFDHATNRYPNAAEMRTMRNITVQEAKPPIIMWFMANMAMGWPDIMRQQGWRDPEGKEMSWRWQQLKEGAFSRPYPNQDKRPVTKNKQKPGKRK